MKPITVGDVRVSSIIERDGPWRAPNIMFASATPDGLAQVMKLVPGFTYAHWKQATDPGFAAVHEDCVEPIVQAGRAVLVDDSYVLSEHVDTDTLVIPTHFPGPTAGRIERLRDTFEFKFLAP